MRLRLLVVGTMVLLSAAVFAGGASAASSSATASARSQARVDICHATDSSTNPFVEMKVSDREIGRAHV